MPASLITSPSARLAAELQDPQRSPDTLEEEPPGARCERELARHALPFVLGLLGCFVAAIALMGVVKPAFGGHLIILLGLCSAMLGALAMWIVHDGMQQHA